MMFPVFKLLAAVAVCSCLLFTSSVDAHDIDCWRGQKCNSCNSAGVKYQNGEKVCCPSCEANSITLGPGSYCRCKHIHR